MGRRTKSKAPVHHPAEIIIRGTIGTRPLRAIRREVIEQIESAPARQYIAAGCEQPSRLWRRSPPSRALRPERRCEGMCGDSMSSCSYPRASAGRRVPLRETGNGRSIDPAWKQFAPEVRGGRIRARSSFPARARPPCESIRRANRTVVQIETPCESDRRANQSRNEVRDPTVRLSNPPLLTPDGHPRQRGGFHGNGRASKVGHLHPSLRSGSDAAGSPAASVHDRRALQPLPGSAQFGSAGIRQGDRISESPAVPTPRIP